MSLIISSGEFKGRKIKAPKGSVTRPSSSKCRQAVFNIYQDVEGLSFLDLFAGSGAMGIEALSRKASFVVFVDKDKESINTIKQNIQDLNLLKKTNVLFSDVFISIKKISDTFDIIFIDPPYKLYQEKSFLENLLSSIDNFGLLKKDGTVFLEAPSNIDLDLFKSENIKDKFSLKKTYKYGSSSLIYLIYS
jgi:16S rRNA (guanine966-N2)-methyltransferase